MWVEYYQLPKNAGICCDHCGTYIRNVFVLHFVDGVCLKCGVECYNKLIKQSNISQYGEKLLKKQIKRLKLYDEMRSNWTRWNTPEEAESDGCFQRIEDPEKPGFYRIRTQAEFEAEKAFMLNDLIPYRINLVQSEIKAKFKRITIPHE